MTSLVIISFLYLFGAVGGALIMYKVIDIIMDAIVIIFK